MSTLRMMGHLVWITLLSWSTLCASQDTDVSPPSFYSAIPSLSISFSASANCPNGSCPTANLVAGGCYNFLEYQGQNINDNLQSLLLNGNFSCRIFADTDCFGATVDVTASVPNFGTSYPTMSKLASALKCGTKSQIADELMLITSKVKFCTGGFYSGSCSIIYPYHTRCYDLSRLAQQTQSVQIGDGMYCTLFSQSGCGGSFVDIPIGGSQNLAAYQGFQNQAVSFKCAAAI